jgi:oligopeptide/dipeptide ABC transporter ATP-binding protein
MSTDATATPVLEIEDLTVRFRTGRGVARAVNGISLTVRAGERVAIVGESGSGKTASLMAALGLLPTPPAIVEATRVRVAGHDLLDLSDKERRQVLGRDVAVVFQDALGSLNPVLRMGRQIVEAPRAHQGLDRREARDRAISLLEQVEVPDPDRRVDQYPHQLSGGMRQRAMIAMALSGEPRLLIADEPTTALDVTVQAQILDLVRGLEQLAIVWVTHDLGVVAGLADRVVVMYAGSIVEEGSADQVFSAPMHPYTRGLIGSVPHFAGDDADLPAIPGTPPEPLHLPVGCAFAERCPLREPRCTAAVPALASAGDGQRAACFVTVGSEVRA